MPTQVTQPIVEGLQLNKTRAELDSSTVLIFETNILRVSPVKPPTNAQPVLNTQISIDEISNPLAQKW